MRIKIHTLIAANCVKYNTSQEYFAWMIATKLSEGTGKVSIKSVEQIYKDTFGITSKTFKKIIERGRGTFWSVQSKELFLVSLRNLCKKCEAILYFGACFEVELSRIKLAEASPLDCLISFIVLGGKERKPVSLKYLAEKMDCSISKISRHIHDQIVEVGKVRRNSQQVFSNNVYNEKFGLKLPSAKEKSYVKKLSAKPRNKRSQLCLV